MKFNKLLIAVLPLLLSGCSQAEESKQYPAINDQQTIMKEYYRQHTSNQSYLNYYELKDVLYYDPTYDVFGTLAPVLSSADDPVNKFLDLEATVGSAKNLYCERTFTNIVGVYSGYFTSNNKLNIYLGNKNNVGSFYENEKNKSFWFRPFDEGHEGKVELIRREESKDNDLDLFVTDYHTEDEVDTDNVSHYFSNNINTEYSKYFFHPLQQPIPSTNRQVSAYLKAEDEIVETYKEVTEFGTIDNPIHPSEEYELTVVKQIVGKTTFKRIEGIGWVGTYFEEKTSYSLISDYELKLLEEPRVIISDEMTINFTYAATMQPYPGEAYTFQEEDPKIKQYRPSVFLFDGESYHDLNASCHDVSREYKKVHPEFSGYAYSFSSIYLEEGALYCFACKEDIEAGQYETIGYAQLTSRAGGTIVSGGLADHNFIKTITTTEAYEFVVLVSTTGIKSLVAQLHA